MDKVSEELQTLYDKRHATLKACDDAMLSELLFNIAFETCPNEDLRESVYSFILNSNMVNGFIDSLSDEEGNYED